MAAAEILAVGNTAATSADVVLTDNTAAVFGLKGVTGPNARVWIDVKDDASGWNPIDLSQSLSSAQPMFVMQSVPSTIRFRREAGATCGVFRAA